MSTFSRWLKFVGFTFFIASAAACSDADEQASCEPIHQDETAVSGSPGNERIITNGLQASILSSERNALLDLSDQALGEASLSGSPLFGSAEGRKLLGYVVKCALGWEDSLIVLKSDTRYIFEGGIGLTLGWKNGPLTPSDRRWLGACLLAHANAYGVEVPLSLRGSHPALATTPEELVNFPVQEGAFYGNFLEQGTTPVAYSCAGTAQNDGCQLEANEWLQERACARMNESQEGCGMEWAGNCYAIEMAGDGGACNALNGEAYPECHSAMPLGAPEPAVVFSEVITVYLQPAADGRCD